MSRPLINVASIEEQAVERFTTLFHATYGKVFGYVARRTNREQANDIVAEVFSTAWTHFDRIPPEPLPWLYRTAWHAIGNRRRSAGRQAGLAARLANDAETAPTPRDPADLVVAGSEALAALATLNSKDREVVQLICWEELSIGEAASVLECSPGAVKVRLHRARRRLTAALADFDSHGVSATRSMICSSEGDAS